MDRQSHIAIIILAAGASSRMGTPKQLLPYQNSSLIRSLAGTALHSKAEKVIIVLGHWYEDIRKELDGLDVELVHNSEWKSGMSSSLRMGLNVLGKNIEAAIVLLCDQPKVTTALLDAIIRTYEHSRKPIIACRYGTTVGVPALFDRSLFEELQKLQGDIGAKKIIERRASDRRVIEFPEGDVDIDTPEEYQRIKI